MPPSAWWNAPSAWATAPVNAPLAWPNSSDSNSPSAIAAQLIATKGPSAAGDWLWSPRAASSLPVPLSPINSTGASWAAMRASDPNRRRITVDPPTISPNASSSRLCSAVVRSTMNPCSPTRTSSPGHSGVISRTRVPARNTAAWPASTIGRPRTTRRNRAWDGSCGSISRAAPGPPTLTRAWRRAITWPPRGPRVIFS